jgi:hypothetical protein
MQKRMTTADAVRVTISVVGAAIAFIVVYQLARAAITGDAGLLVGCILGTYAGVAVPFAVVRWAGGTEPVATGARSGAHA